MTRTISDGLQEIIFVGLNPSDANSREDDPTVRRLISYCREWGYGKLFVINLFGRVSRDPMLLSRVNDPIGDENDKKIKSIIEYWSANSYCDLWLGWGNKGSLNNRDKDVLRIIEENMRNRRKTKARNKAPLALGATKNGQPLHPLYLPKGIYLETFYLFE